MPTDKLHAEQHVVSAEDLFQHASLGVLRDAAAGLPHAAGWLSGRLRREPIQIYDINGVLLFLDYEVVRGSDTLGYVRTPASKIVGGPVIAVEIGPRSWDYAAAVKRLAPKVKKEFPGAKVSEPKLVCYSYPKLGVMYDMISGGMPGRLIYDVADLARIQERPQKPENEGSYAWSYYDALDDQERRARLRRFEESDAARTELSARVLADITSARSLQTLLPKVKLELKSSVTKLLQYCSHYEYTHPRGHHCFSLHGQQVNDYCAVATCQMILCYYRYCYAQVDVAPACSYNPGGGCPADSSPGYETLSCNHLDATFDNSPTWQKGRDQIDQLHPFKSGVPGHARAVAGYSRTTWVLRWSTDNKLYIYDPWPWNADFALAGTVAWEDWTSIEHTNYVTTRVACP